MSDEPQTTTDSRSDALTAAGKRRVELKYAVTQVEIAAARPAAEPNWASQLGHELSDLLLALDQHVEEVEGPHGLLTELAAEAPRLMNQIEFVRGEHPTLCRRAKRVLDSVERIEDPDQIRGDVLDLLVGVARHRQRGSDLVYAAYNVDIGGG